VNFLLIPGRKTFFTDSITGGVRFHCVDIFMAGIKSDEARSMGIRRAGATQRVKPGTGGLVAKVGVNLPSGLIAKRCITMDIDLIVSVG
jgi:hypothetical protein